MLGEKNSHQVLLIAYLDRHVKDIPSHLTRVYKYVGADDVQLCML